MSIYLIFLSIYLLSIYLSNLFNIPIYLSIYRAIYLIFYLSIYLSIYLSCYLNFRLLQMNTSNCRAFQTTSNRSDFLKPTSKFVHKLFVLVIIILLRLKFLTATPPRALTLQTPKLSPDLQTDLAGCAISFLTD